MKKFYLRLFGVSYLYIWCFVIDFKDFKDFKEFIVYDYGFVKIILFLVVVKFEGFVNVIKGNESVVIFSVFESYDFEEIYKKIEGFVLIWYCGGGIILYDNRDGFFIIFLSDVGCC